MSRSLRNQEPEDDERAGHESLGVGSGRGRDHLSEGDQEKLMKMIRGS